MYVAEPSKSYQSVSVDAFQNTLHQQLSQLNARRLAPALTAPTAGEIVAEVVLRRSEERFVAGERAAVAHLLEDVPAEPEPFEAWFESLRGHGPGQNDNLFPWLAGNASLDEVRWFLGQEVAGEAGFDDLIALTQLRMPSRPKLEMARNFWDEMGRGHSSGVHGHMLNELADGLDVRIPRSTTVWPSLALANLMMALAWNRHHAYQSVGALGVIELTAPGRAEYVNSALRRLGVPPGTRKYFAVHATLDVQHSRAWNREVIGPLIAENPECARLIAEGALLRLRAGARCYDCYRRQLSLPSQR
jgi:hypothetical protein